jgi:hypothetical protein
MDNSSRASFVKSPLVVATVLFGVAISFVAFIVTQKFYQIHGGANTITVTGSTQRVITSDVARWSASFSRTVAPDQIKSGTDQIKSDTQAVMAYLKAQGIQDADLTLDPLSITSNTSDKTDSAGNSTQVFTGYTITQSFSVKSNDIAAVGKAATNSGSLIANGILFQTSNPEYYYSKLPELKIELLNGATQDAKARAETLAQNTGSHLGGLRSAIMGVTQITAEDSSDISEDGSYDTSSINKEVTVVVHATFFVK